MDILKKYRLGTIVSKMTDVDTSEKTVGDHVVPFTYSSRLEREDGEHRVVPSRLSLMAYDAACYVARNGGAKRLVIAGEQSYSHSEITTGDALEAHTHPSQHELELTVLRHEGNRLLNTPHQVDALADEFKPEDVVTIVCWGFHEQRIREGFASKRKRSPVVEFVHVEDVIDHLWETAALWDGDQVVMNREFRERYDLQAPWEAVLSRGVCEFARRERVTRIAMKAGKSGWLLKMLTKIRGAGRYDDIDEFAMPIMRSTKRLHKIAVIH